MFAALFITMILHWAMAADAPAAAAAAPAAAAGAPAGAPADAPAAPDAGGAAGATTAKSAADFLLVTYDNFLMILLPTWVLKLLIAD